VEDKKYHNVSEAGSVSVLRWMGQDKPTQLGPLERASLNHWTWTCGIFSLSHTRRWIKSKTSSIALYRLRMFESRVLRRIFGLKRDEVTGRWRKLYNEELHNLYSSPSIIRMMKSRRLRWAGHVAQMG
jgi:hypothetical protein